MINIAKFQQIVQQKMASASNATDLLFYGKILKKIKDTPVLSVATFSALPSASSNPGVLYYVELDDKVYTSDSVSWISLVYFGQRQTLLWTWGYNYNGQLGDGTGTDRSSPGTVLPGGATWWTSASASGAIQTVAAVKIDGTLWTWGNNVSGQLGTGNTTSRSSPGTVAGGDTDWLTPAVGDRYTVAIKTDGTLWTWGYNVFGMLGTGNTTDRSSPGTVAGGGTTWSSVDCGKFETGAIKTDGTLWTWGNNASGQLGTGNTTNRSSPGTVAGGGTDWKQVSMGGNESSAAVKTNGTLWTWGYNYYGTLGDSTFSNRSSPGTTAGGGTDWSSVSVGNYATAAVKNDGTLWTWGGNYWGQLGTGDSTSRRSPGTTAGGGTTWSQVSAGYKHMAAVKTDGTLWTWGLNGYGVLGTGDTTSRKSPVTVAGGGTLWSKVSSGKYMIAAIAFRTS